MKIKLNKFSFIFYIFLFSLSFINISLAGWSWNYYQIYNSKLNTYSSTIYNGLLNDNLSSSYYINKGSLSSSSNNISRVEGNIFLFVQENGDFNDLSGFSVTDYNGNSDYFTAFYNGQNFASTICNTFQNGKILDVNMDSDNKLYINLTVGGVTKKIIIASYNSKMGIYGGKLKITNGYYNCANPKSPLSYRIIYYTHYKRDISKPTASISSIYLTGGAIYNSDNWVNVDLYAKIKCVDNPSDEIGNSGCSRVDFVQKIPNQMLLSDAGIYYAVQDNIPLPNTNTKTGYLKVNAKIDKTPPNLRNNRIRLKGLEGKITSGSSYFLSNNITNITLLSDKYDIDLSALDIGDCDASDNTKCRGVSGIKNITIKLNGRDICSSDYIEYNTGTLMPSETVNFHCSIDNLTIIGDYILKLEIKDFAGNRFNEIWNLHVKPNKPDINKFEISILSGNSNIYSTYMGNDYYKISFKIKDQWGNLVNKQIEDVLFTDKSHIDLDTYNNPSINTNNAISMFDKLLFLGTGSFIIRSLVPGNINSEYIFKVHKFGKNYVNTSDYWNFKKDFIKNVKFNQPITLGSPSFYDMSGNLITKDKLVSQTYYKIVYPVSISGFDDNNYSYNISVNTGVFKAISDNYRIIDIKDIINNNKYNGSSSLGNLSFVFKFSMVAGGNSITKGIAFYYNPYIKLGVSSKYGLFPLGEQVGTGDDIDMGISIIGFKISKGHTNTIGQGKKNFNIVSSKVKSKIRSNAYGYINSLKNDTISNGVLVHNGNYNLNLTNYTNLLSRGVGTLIIRNGNIAISTNIEKRLDIAVVLDKPTWNYNDIGSYTLKGNIIIKPNVTFINGLLYVDRSLLVGDNNGNILSSNSDSRSSLLKKQLFIYGTLISKNTIGGSIMDSNNNYILPGGKKTSSSVLSSYFDLAFFRVGNDGYNNGINKEYNNGKRNNLIIVYNTDIKNNPRKLLK